MVALLAIIADVAILQCERRLEQWRRVATAAKAFRVLELERGLRDEIPHAPSPRHTDRHGGCSRARSCHRRSRSCCGGGKRGACDAQRYACGASPTAATREL